MATNCIICLEMLDYPVQLPTPFTVVESTRSQRDMNAAVRRRR